MAKASWRYEEEEAIPFQGKAAEIARAIQTV